MLKTINPACLFRRVLLLTLCMTVPALCQQPSADSPQIEQRVESMVSKLSLQQKVDLLGGKESWYIGPIPEIGLPRLTMSDGPMAVKMFGVSTVFANGAGLAAAWDPALAARVGAAMGAEARGMGVNFLLAPGMNIYRSPLAGRNFEYLGEDPLLAGKTATAFIQGVQSQGVIATAKHFAVNNQEYDRHGGSSDLDERTLREIYLPAFEMAVKEGHVGAIMDSYNLINGVHATQNSLLNCEIAKKEWKFDGVIMSDWDATYDGVAAANGCMDIEMPTAKFMNAATLIPAVNDGRVPIAVIDDKVRRILRKSVEFGFFDRDQRDLSSPLYSQQHRELALQGALEGIVLLKNEQNILPLDRKKIRSIAILGPNAWPGAITGGGSAEAKAYTTTSLLAGLGGYLGDDVKIYYDPRSLPAPKTVFERTEFTHAGVPGLKKEVFDSPTITGEPSATSTVGHLSSWPGSEFEWETEKKKSYRFTGTFLPETTGRYLLLTAANGRDAYRLYVDGKQVDEQPHHESQVPHVVELNFTKHTPVAIRYEIESTTAELWAGLGIVPAEGLISAESAKLAAMADVAVVAAGFDPTTESEGTDRNFQLPFGQDELIRQVAAANPRTIVVLNSGGGVDMTHWKDRVPSILEAWYPGQEGGTALARILFGDDAPEGKLPMSFETRWEDNPTHDNYYPKTTAKHVNYGEGVFVGYRYYAGNTVKPLFPFGFGLTYTTFGFSNLKITPEKPRAGETVTVTLDVKNTGSRAGAEIAQLYLGDASAAVKRPERELKGFEKVRLAPGELRHISFTLDQRAMSYWDVTTHGWKADPGTFTVFAGDSSENTPLQSSFILQP